MGTSNESTIVILLNENSVQLPSNNVYTHRAVRLSALFGGLLCAENVANADAHDSESREVVSVEASVTGGLSHTHPSATIKEDRWKDRKSQRSAKTRMRQ